MAPAQEPSALKRRKSTDGDDTDAKKPRRSQRIHATTDDQGPSDQKVEAVNNQLPTPVTRKESTNTDTSGAGPLTPPPAPRLSQVQLSSPPSDTQAFSQFVFPPTSFPLNLSEEDDQGVWGYLAPLKSNKDDILVLKARASCPMPNSGEPDNTAAGGFLIGRHSECDHIVQGATISNRHCLLFSENKKGGAVAILEDLSSNGTFVNEALVGRNKRRELAEGDEIAIVDEARFIFRYPRNRSEHGFSQLFSIQAQLGKGHFASVYLCIEKSTGIQYAVKKFDKRSGGNERSKVEGLQQEIAVLMSISHPTLLCLKNTFDEKDGVYIVLELAPEGELFNWIVMKQKLTEDETRKIFKQLFDSIQYLHDRNIVHRDIKPENILLTTKDLDIKLADFGLAKIIGEESFTTTLCGTPSYVAPEILQKSNHRRYTRAVDVWSLGVVLYICLCGFPPFSDELNTPDNPYTLPQQIQLGRFDYPSPYWDSVCDEALDLIDQMLTVDVSKRATIEDCLQHPWMTQNFGKKAVPSLTDSTDGLTGALGGLDFSKRKTYRERTLLSDLNDVRVSQVIDSQRDDEPGIKIFQKMADQASQPTHADNVAMKDHAASNDTAPANGENGAANAAKEASPAANRAPAEFMEMGGRGDPTLFADDAGSRYGP